jgi:hypothetical protein
MGEVFLALDQLLQRRVAIKEILGGRETGLDPVAIERLIREARLAAGIQHPNVVAVHDLIVEDGQTFIVMEYLDARSLAEMIRTQGTLDPATVAKVGNQVAGALETAHRAGITHRDVKPSNILIDTGGHAKLADFGVARGSGDSALTGTGMMIGSLAFMSPEVARGEPAGSAADVFSLGCTLFAATEGHAPFTDATEPTNGVRTLVRLVSETAPPATHAGPLEPLLARMLDSDPKARPSAGEVQRQLAALSVAADAPAPIAAPVAAVVPEDETGNLTVKRVPADVSVPGETTSDTTLHTLIASRAPAPLPAEEPTGTEVPEDATVRRANPALAPAVPVAAVTTAKNRRRTLVAALGGVAVVLLAAVVWFASQQAGPGQSALPASGATVASASAQAVAAAPSTTTPSVSATPAQSTAPTVARGTLVRAGSIKFKGNLNDIALDLDRGLIYGVNGSHTIQIADLSQQEVVETTSAPVTSGGPGWDGVGYSNATLLVSGDTHYLTVIDAGTGKIRARIGVGKKYARDVEADDEGRVAVVLNEWAGTSSVSLVDLLHRKVVKTLTIDGGAGRVTLASLGLAFISGYSNVAVVSLADRRVVKRLKVGRPMQVEIDESAQQVYVVEDSGNIVVFDVDDWKKVGKIKGLTWPGAMAIDPIARLLFVWTRDGITVIDAETREVLGTTEVPAINVGAIKVDQERHHIYVMEELESPSRVYVLSYTP